MQIKRTELMALANTLATLNEKKLSAKCAYAISKNIKSIASEVTVIEELRTKIEKEYEDERTSICEKFCDRDENGEPKTENGNYVGLVGNETFSEALIALTNKTKPGMDEFNELMVSNVEIDFYMVDVELLPELKPSEMTSLLPIIKD